MLHDRSTEREGGDAVGVANDVVYTWHGTKNRDGHGWREFFYGIPARDLTKEDVDALDAEGKANLKGEAGKRLYHAVESKPAKTEDKGGN